MFSDFGTIADAALIMDRMSGRSKGIAFVTFETEDEAKAAIDGLNGHEIDGRAIVVNVARPRVPRTDFGGGRGGDRRGGDNRGGQRRY
ncbi:MAG: RNA-binding protein [Candidatus Pacebacteria bacterium CG10_big_fil_rev_8_21_14_0_10_40_26]|nr:MAG: RNA-binding protein [Candidatus Pacebacteria bacterium CG10_big_fil_rev_8_21_14_0_10_40_26]